MKKSKKVLSLLLAALMILSLMPLTAFAETEIPLVTVTKGGVSTDYYASDYVSETSKYNAEGRLLDYLFATQLKEDASVVLNRDCEPDMNGFVLLGAGSQNYFTGKITYAENIPTITLDFNGHKIASSDPENDGLQVFNANLIVEDSSSEKTGGFSCHGSMTLSSGGNSNITVYSGTFTTDHVNGSFIGRGISKLGDYVSNADGTGYIPGTATLYGGTFSGTIPQAPANEIPEGYEAVDNGDGTFTVIEAVSNVAEIGGVGYATLEEAIANVKSGETISFVDDIDLTSKYEAGSCNVFDFTEGAKENVVIDLNGYTLTTNNFSVVFQGNGLTIKNGNLVAANNGSYALFIGDENTTTGCVIDNVNCTGGINAFNTSLTVKSTTCTNAVGTNYYAIWGDEGSTITVEGGNFTSTSTKGGCVIYNAGASAV